MRHAHPHLSLGLVHKYTAERERLSRILRLVTSVSPGQL